jgi:peptidoglycan/LPS O-acetylase OafA/YrhL
MVVKETSFGGYAYRTGSRFGSRVRVSVDDRMVTVTGPRIGVLVYRLWIAVQVILFWSIPLALLTAAVLWDWRYVATALMLAVGHWAVGTFGAVCFWELANVIAFTEGAMGQTAMFSVSTVKRVKIGRGWARNGPWLETIMAVCFWGFATWFLLIAILGFGRRILDFSNRVLTYASEVAYPFYILHQTVIVAIGYYVVRWNVGVLLKFLIINVAAAVTVTLVYEVLVKRINGMRVLFGMKPQAKQRPSLRPADQKA